MSPYATLKQRISLNKSFYAKSAARMITESCQLRTLSLYTYRYIFSVLCSSSSENLQSKKAFFVSSCKTSLSFTSKDCKKYKDPVTPLLHCCVLSNLFITLRVICPNFLPATVSLIKPPGLKPERSDEEILRKAPYKSNVTFSTNLPPQSHIS